MIVFFIFFAYVIISLIATTLYHYPTVKLGNYHYPTVKLGNNLSYIRLAPTTGHSRGTRWLLPVCGTLRSLVKIASPTTAQCHGSRFDSGPPYVFIIF